jgi:chromosome segregation ATPase
VSTSESTGTTTSNGGKPDKEQLEAQIEQTREQLGETVEALTAKLDVKGRTRARLSETKDRTVQQVQVVQQRAAGLTRQAKQAATTDQGKPKPAVSAGAAGVAALVVTLAALIIWRKGK